MGVVKGGSSCASTHQDLHVHVNAMAEEEDEDSERQANDGVAMGEPGVDIGGCEHIWACFLVGGAGPKNDPTSSVGRL